MTPNTLAALTEFPSLLEAQFSAVPIELRHWRPGSWEGIPSERLTVVEQICHVRDIEIEGYQVRFQRTLTEDCPVLPDLAGEALAEQRNYARMTAADVLASFTAARAATIRTLRGLTKRELDRAAIFENRPTTLRGLVYYLCSHDYQHLAGLQWLLGRAQEARRGT